MASLAKIYLGKAADGDVFWIPKKEKNPHFMVVGTSGSGKTETLKAVIYELHKNGIPCLIIDFHQDFEDAGDVLDFNNITINPLEYGAETPENVMYKVSHILKKIFNLGVQQEGILQDAIQKSYTDKGINIKERTGKNPPTFDDVRTILEERVNKLREDRHSTQTIETLLVRLRPLFNTGFFTDKKSLPFAQIFKKTTVLRLKDMPTEEVKYAVAEFFINKLKYELYHRGKTDSLALYCIVDEAHRLIDERSPLNDLLRESRKYGTGVILSSQRPSDFSDTVLANLGGILSFQCRLDSDAMFVARQIGVDFETIKNLTEIGTGYVNFSSDETARKIKIVPEWERMPQKEREKIKQEKKKREAGKTEEHEGKEERKIPVHAKSEPAVAKDRSRHNGEGITVVNETESPLMWPVNGFRALFPNPAIGALFTIAFVLSSQFIGYIYWAGLLAVLVALLAIIGRRR